MMIGRSAGFYDREIGETHRRARGFRVVSVGELLAADPPDRLPAAPVRR
jgi:hypothetical protein